MIGRLSVPSGRSSNPPSRPARSVGSLVLIGVPMLLGLLFVWQLTQGLMRPEVVARGAVAVSRVALESDPNGTRLEMVLVDRLGAETTVNADVTVKVREPDGSVWQATRTIGSSNFAALPAGGLLSGRLGYSVLIPSTDWVRAPRRGGAASVSITVQPSDGSAAFSTMAEERFP
jgi:hypothetical protein